MKRTIHIAADRLEFFETIPEVSPSAKVNRALELAECLVSRVMVEISKRFSTSIPGAAWRDLRDMSRSWGPVSTWTTAMKRGVFHDFSWVTHSDAVVIDWMLDRWASQGVQPWG